jgi:hypothetical protein
MRQELDLAMVPESLRHFWESTKTEEQALWHLAAAHGLKLSNPVQVRTDLYRYWVKEYPEFAQWLDPKYDRLRKSAIARLKRGSTNIISFARSTGFDAPKTNRGWGEGAARKSLKAFVSRLLEDGVIRVSEGQEIIVSLHPSYSQVDSLLPTAMSKKPRKELVKLFGASGTNLEAVLFWLLDDSWVLMSSLIEDVRLDVAVTVQAANQAIDKLASVNVAEFKVDMSNKSSWARLCRRKPKGLFVAGDPVCELPFSQSCRFGVVSSVENLPDHQRLKVRFCGDNFESYTCGDRCWKC